MPAHESPSVHELAIESVGQALLDGDGLALVVTGEALRLGVALVAYLLLPSGVIAVVAQEGHVVAHERHRHELAQRAAIVAWHTLGLGELVGVARQAFGHRRKHLGCGIATDDAFVASHALTGDLWKPDVVGVHELDTPFGSLRRGKSLSRGRDLRRTGRVALGAARQRRDGLRLGLANTGVARQAGRTGRLSRLAAGPFRQVLAMGKTRRAPLLTAHRAGHRSDRDAEHTEQERRPHRILQSRSTETRANAWASRAR